MMSKQAAFVEDSVPQKISCLIIFAVIFCGAESSINAIGVAYISS